MFSSICSLAIGRCRASFCNGQWFGCWSAISLRKSSNHKAGQKDSKDIGENGDILKLAKQSQHVSYIKAIRQLEEIKKYSLSRKLILAAAFVMLVTGVYLYVFTDVLHDLVATEVSIVATKSLEDDALLNKAGQLSKEVLHNVLHDEEMREQTATFVTAILTTSETKNATTSLLVSVLQDPHVIDVLSDKLKTIFLQILNSDDTRQIVLSQTTKLLNEDPMKSAVQELLYDVTTRPEVQETFALFFKKVLSSEAVTAQGNELGKAITESVLSDETMQKQAGQAIWSAVKYSVTPRMLLTPSEEDLTDDAIKQVEQVTAPE